RRLVEGVLHRRWRRHARGDRQIRRLGQDRLYLHRRRRVPRTPRGQDASRRGDPRRARGETMMRSTKIVATLGPASSEASVLEKMFLAGVDVVRLNFSHGTTEDHLKRAELVREICRKTGRTVGIMADLQGPKIRVGKFKDGKITLAKGDEFTLDADRELGDTDGVGLD